MWAYTFLNVENIWVRVDVLHVKEEGQKKKATPGACPPVKLPGGRAGCSLCHVADLHLHTYSRLTKSDEKPAAKDARKKVINTAAAAPTSS